MSRIIEAHWCIAQGFLFYYILVQISIPQLPPLICDNGQSDRQVSVGLMLSHMTGHLT